MYGATTSDAFARDVPRGASVAIPTSVVPFVYVALETPTLMASWSWLSQMRGPRVAALQRAAGQGCSDAGAVGQG